jgi:large subunit ribosomal protein L9
MEVILLEQVENLGGIGDKVKVKSGYGRNYLIPQGKATPATADNIAKFEARRAELEAKAAAELSEAEGRAASVAELKLVIRAKAGSEGKLFGSIGTVDIAEAAGAVGVELARSEIRLPEGPIRVVGEHTIEVHLHTDVNVEVPVLVEVEE